MACHRLRLLIACSKLTGIICINFHRSTTEFQKNFLLITITTTCISKLKTLHFLFFCFVIKNVYACFHFCLRPTGVLGFTREKLVALATFDVPGKSRRNPHNQRVRQMDILSQMVYGRVTLPTPGARSV